MGIAINGLFILDLASVKLIGSSLKGWTCQALFLVFDSGQQEVNTADDGLAVACHAAFGDHLHATVLAIEQDAEGRQGFNFIHQPHAAGAKEMADGNGDVATTGIKCFESWFCRQDFVSDFGDGE